MDQEKKETIEILSLLSRMARVIKNYIIYSKEHKRRLQKKNQKLNYPVIAEEKGVGRKRRRRCCPR